jgi:PTH2 family peptidyl-tRNA hydrolase
MQKNDATTQWIHLATSFLIGGILAYACLKLTTTPKQTPTTTTPPSIAAEIDDDETSEEEADLSDYSSEEEDQEERKKLVLVVRTDLKMKTGKIAAQCSHATLGVYRKIVQQHKKQPTAISKRNIQWLKYWNVSGCAKIAVRCESLEQMNLIKSQVKQANLPYYTVIDAGKTQIAAYSATVLAVFGPEAEVNKYTGTLKLL